MLQFETLDVAAVKHILQNSTGRKTSTTPDFGYLACINR